MNFGQKLKQINDEAYKIASSQHNEAAHGDLINRYGTIVSFMAKNGYTASDDFIEP